MDLPRNHFKRRLQAGEQQIGLWVTIPDPGVAEAMAGAGFDWLAVDLEHSVITIREAEELGRLAWQIFGNDPDIMADAARRSATRNGQGSLNLEW